MIGVQSLGPIMPRRVAEAAPAADPGRVGVGDCRADHGTVEAVAMDLESREAAGDAEGAAWTEAATRREAAANLERDAWVVLLSVNGLGPVSFGALLAAFGSARAVLCAATGPGGPALLVRALADTAADVDRGLSGTLFDASAAALLGGAAAAPGSLAPSGRRQIIGADLASRICDAASDAAAVVEQVRRLGLAVVTLEDSCYPQRLREVELPPPLLYVRGSLAVLMAKNVVAVVGTRWPTDKGRLIAGWIGSAIARTGAVVVSGLAVGIDGAAHAAVVAEGGRTVAVLGGGHARLFPKAHERLAEAIVASGGAIVSELAPDTNPSRGTFPRRNRLVSGLSSATVVVEAGRRSGALITAGWALEQGRECFLVPGALDSPASAGCHAFLRSFPGQARVVAGIAELIEDLELGGSDIESRPAVATSGVDEERVAAQGDHSRSAPPSSSSGAGRSAILASLGPVERALAEQLARGAATADQLAARTSLASAAVLSALTLLELRGLATGAYGRYSPSGSLAGWSGPPRTRSE
jgi:DNA processing protein